MYMMYKMKAEELDSRFIRALKAIFKGKEIEIVVCESSNIEEDETAYLLKSPANRERLLKAIEHVAHNRNLITIKTDELE
jgi:antitoxin YefM